MGKEGQTISQDIRKKLGQIDKDCWGEIKNLVFHSGALVYFDNDGNPVGCKVNGIVHGQTTSIAKLFCGNHRNPQSAIVNTTLRKTYEDLNTARHDHAFVKIGHTTSRGKHSQVTRGVLRETCFIWNHETVRRRAKKLK